MSAARQIEACRRAAECSINGIKKLVVIEMTETTYSTGIERLMPRIRFVPVDTGVLLNNISREVLQWPRPTILRQLMDSWTLRPYAAAHVRDEMEEKLDGWIRDRGRDPVLARRIWQQNYLPRLWFVDTGTLGIDDPRVQAEIARDSDDAPTAVLASILGVRVLSEDRDLVDYGLASGRPWLEVIFAVGDASRGETVDFMLALGVSISGHTVADIARAVQSLASTPGGKRLVTSAGVVILGLLLVGILIWICVFDEDKRKWLTDRVRTAGAAVASGSRVCLEAYTKLSQNRFEGMTRLRTEAVPAIRPLGPLEGAARILAAGWGSLSTKELARRLWGYKRVPTPVTRYLYDQLSACPAFVEIAPGEWQFGMPGGELMGEDQA